MRTIILLFAANAYAFTGFTQVSKTVQWQFSALPIDDDVIMLKISADIVPGWHLYSQFIPRGGPLPTQITFEKQKGLLLIGCAEEKGEAYTFYDEVYEMNITWYSEKVIFLQKLKVTEPVRILRGKVEYMTCDTYSCFPDSMDFAIEIFNSIRKP